MFLNNLFKSVILSNLIISIYCQGLLELTCGTDADCMPYQLPGYNTTCLGSQCICNNFNGDIVTCVPKESNLNNIIGGQCPCTQEFAICNEDEKVCLCQNDYVPSIDHRRCVQKNCRLDESCENNSQCILQDKFSECDMAAKKCKCQQNFIQHENVCMSIVGLGESCIDSQQCMNETDNSICANNKCVCDSGYIASSDDKSKKSKCLPASGYNEKCFETSQCHLKLGVGSVCYSGQCSCDSQHYFIQLNSAAEKLCERRVEPGQYCTEHNHCYQYHLKNDEQNMECFFGGCMCRRGYYLHEFDCLKNDSSSNMAIVSLLISAIVLEKLIS